MNTANSEEREWYQKKRFIIPAALLGGFLVFGGESAPTPVSVTQSANVTPAVIDRVPVRFEPEVTAPAVTSKPAAREVESESSCHPSYSGCLEMNAGDYDCASGSGNGPNYTGAVEVYGSDPFDLDRDNDGWGCE